MSSPRYGLGTGFFFRLFDETERARSVWAAIVDGTAGEVVSTCELQGNALKGARPGEDVEGFLDELSLLCTVHDMLTTETVLPMTDVLILQTFLDGHVTRIRMTDSDVTTYEGEPTVEVL